MALLIIYLYELKKSICWLSCSATSNDSMLIPYTTCMTKNFRPCVQIQKRCGLQNNRYIGSRQNLAPGIVAQRHRKPPVLITYMTSMIENIIFEISGRILQTKNNVARLIVCLLDLELENLTSRSFSGTSKTCIFEV